MVRTTDAKQTLEGAKFTVPAATPDFDNDVKKGDVIRTEPAAHEQAPYGSEVKVHVSKGPDLVKVPNLVNRPIKEAQRVAESSGLVLEVAGRFHDNWLVSNQSPCDGKSVRRGSTVRVELDRNGSFFNGCF